MTLNSFCLEGLSEKNVADAELRSQVRVLLCSIKAASLGLNLTMAHKVILLDCWWNAATEEQVRAL